MKKKIPFLFVAFFFFFSLFISLAGEKGHQSVPESESITPPVIDYSLESLEEYFKKFSREEKDESVRLEIRKLLNGLYNSKNFSRIISIYEENREKWEKNNYYLPRKIIGKAYFKEKRYEEALFQYEQWYEETADLDNVPSFRDPRFFIIRTLLFLHPSIALSQMISLLLAFVLPLLAFIIFFTNMDRANYFIKPAIILGFIIFCFQCVAHLQLNTFTTRIFFVLLSAFIRNFLFVCAGGVLSLRLRLPCLQLIRSFRSNRKPHHIETRQLILKESLTALAIMILLTGLLYFVIQPTESPLIAKLGKYFEHPLLTSSLHLNKPSLLLSFVIVGTIVEELYVRLFGIPLLLWLFRRTKWRELLAICVTSLYWALAHAGMVTPEWYKILQVFLMGLVLGILFLRRGIEASILTHVCINVSGVILFLVLGGKL